jgi:Tol biopolymer transport system component/DNA-binding winged helix-turn-helix (wHTH) protein
MGGRQYFQFGSFRLDPTRRLLSRQGQVIPLTPKVLDTLLVLVENRGRAVDKEELMKAVWPDTFVEEGNLTQNISTLRKVLGESPTDHAYIETIPKRGYRFVAVVTESRPGRWLIPRRALLWAGVLLAFLGIAVAGLWLASRRTAPPESLVAVPLTSYPGLELNPSFSPDGNHVAFAWNGEKQDNFDIYVKLIGAQRPLRITDHPARDYRPAWSPDGRFMAFLRETGAGHAAVLVIPAIGGLERRLALVFPESRGARGYLGGSYLEWTADGKWLATTDASSPEEPMGLFLISVATGEKRRLTSPPRLYLGDRNAAFSPDSRVLAFSRDRGGHLGELCLLALSSELAPEAEPKCTDLGQRAARSLLWTRDGREIIYSAHYASTGRPGLFRVAVSELRGRSGLPQRLPTNAASAWDPAISPNGRRLAYSSLLIDGDIWRLDLFGPGARTTRLISSTHLDANPQYSPDGQSIVFFSTRSGRPAIWLRAGDGSETQLTSFEAPMTGSPRWSPDGNRIVFDSNLEGDFRLYTIHPDGGGLRRLTRHLGNSAVASWSKDGRWIYFASNRTGEHQVWKIPAVDGEAVQLTRNGGYVAFESPDGKYVYYSKFANTTSVWRVPAGGGEETKVLDSVRPFDFAVVEDGIYFASPTDRGRSIRFLRFATGAVAEIAEIKGVPFNGLSVSPDGRFLLYSSGELVGSDLMLVENFR